MPNGTPRQTRNGGGWGIGVLIVIVALIIIGWGWGGWGGGGWWRGHNTNQTAANSPTNNTGTPTKTLDNNGAPAPANNGAPAPAH